MRFLWGGAALMCSAMESRGTLAWLGFDERELQSRRAIFELTEDDLQRIAALRPVAERHMDAIVEGFYRLLLGPHMVGKRIGPEGGA